MATAIYPNNAAVDGQLLPALSGVSVPAAVAQIAAEIEAIESQLINSGLAVIHFADRETPGGAIDGANAVFSLAHTPSPAASLQLFHHAAGTPEARLVPSTDYALAAAALTLKNVPGAGDTFTAWYRY